MHRLLKYGALPRLFHLVNSANNGQFFCSWILKDCLEIQGKKTKITVLCLRPPWNVKSEAFSRRSIPAEACGLQDDVILLCLASSTTPRPRNLLVALAHYSVTHFRSSSTKPSSWFLSSLLYKKAWCTCRVVGLLMKAVYFFAVLVAVDVVVA